MIQIQARIGLANNGQVKPNIPLKGKRLPFFNADMNVCHMKF
jgi:hypothetical protein